MYLCIIIGFSLSLFAFLFACFHFFYHARRFCVYPRAFYSKRHVDFILLHLPHLPLPMALCICVRVRVCACACVRLFLRLYWVYRAYRLLAYVIVFVCSMACRLIPFFVVLCMRTEFALNANVMYSSSTLVVWIDLSLALNGF